MRSSRRFLCCDRGSATLSNKTFYGKGTGYLKLPPYTSLNPVDPVTIEDDIETPDFIEQDGMLVIEKYALGFPPPNDEGQVRTGWPLGQAITVSAIWGWSEVPGDIQLAVIHLALHGLAGKRTRPLPSFQRSRIRRRIKESRRSQRRSLKSTGRDIRRMFYLGSLCALIFSRGKAAI